jgi:hypothetical protein
MYYVYVIDSNINRVVAMFTCLDTPADSPSDHASLQFLISFYCPVLRSVAPTSALSAIKDWNSTMHVQLIIR